MFDYTIEEIVDLTASTPGGVKAALHRGREKLDALPPPAAARPAPVLSGDVLLRSHHGLTPLVTLITERAAVA